MKINKLFQKGLKCHVNFALEDLYREMATRNL